MTPELDRPEGNIPEWAETPCGAGVPVNGVDSHAERRTHMREQTMARQAAERRSLQPASGGPRDRSARREAEDERAAVLHEELARLDGEHQAWLAAQGFVEAPLPKRHRSLPLDIVLPKPTR